MPDAVVHQAQQFRQEGWEVQTVFNIGSVHLGAEHRIHDRDFAFRSLLDDQAAYFGGRKEHLEQIRQFSTSEAPYLLIQAPPGFGKTALMAQVVQQPLGELACYFFNKYYSTPELDLTAESTFLDLVCSQLAKIRGMPYHASMSVVEQRSLYLKALTEDSDKPFLLVLDGLDEATFRMVNYFPAKLGRNVHVLATARLEADRDWSRELRLPSAAFRELSGLSATDITEVLRKAGPRAAALAGDAAFVSKVTSTSRGDPFYVRFLAEDINAGLIGPADIEVQPQGLFYYLDRWWQELISTQSLGAEAVDIVGLLYVAHGPLTRLDILTCFSDKPALAFQLDGALARIARFLIGNAEGGYQFCHPRFKDFLVKARKLPPPVAGKYQERLLAFCDGWKDYPKPEEVPAYILKYRVRHRVDLGAQAGWAAFLSPEWIALKLSRFGTHLAAAEDLQYLIDHAPGLPPRELAVLTGLSLKEGVLAERSQELPNELPVALAETGAVDEALGVAQLIRTDLRADSKKAYVLARIAAAVTARGDAARSQELQALALAAARQTEDVPFRVKALTWLASLRAGAAPEQAVGLLREAREAVATLSNNTGGKKSHAYSLIAEQLAPLDPPLCVETLEQALDSLLLPDQLVETEPIQGLIISEMGALDDLSAAPLHVLILRSFEGMREKDDRLIWRVLEKLNQVLPKLHVRLLDSGMPSMHAIREYVQPLFSKDFTQQAQAAWLRARARQHPAELRFPAAGQRAPSAPPEGDTAEHFYEAGRGLIAADWARARELARWLPPHYRWPLLSECLEEVKAPDFTAAREILQELPAEPEAFRGLLVGLLAEWVPAADRREAGLRMLQVARSQAVPLMERAYALARVFAALAGSAPQEAAQALDSIRALLREPHDAEELVRARFQAAAILADVPGAPMRELVEPMLVPRSQQHAYILAQLSPYLTRNHHALAEELITSALQMTERREGLFGGATGGVELKVLIAREVSRWDKARALRLLDETLRTSLGARQRRSFYFNWCLSRFLPEIASVDPKQAEQAASEQSSRSRVGALCAVAGGCATTDRERALRLLSAALEDIGAGRSHIAELPEILRVAGQLGGDAGRDAIIGKALDLLTSHGADDRGEKAEALASSVRVLSGFDLPRARSLATQALELAQTLEDRYSKRDRILAEVLAVCMTEGTDDERILGLLSRSSGDLSYWHDKALGELALWHASQGHRERALEVAHMCRTRSMQAWALIRCFVAASSQVAGFREELKEKAYALINQLGPTHDRAFLLTEYSLALRETDPASARKAAEEAAEVCSAQVENLYGTRSRNQARIALALAPFAPLEALTLAEDCFEGHQTDVLPSIIQEALNAPGVDLAAQLPLMLLERRQASLNAQLVYLGSVIPVLKRIDGLGLVTRVFQSLLDAGRLLDL